jgi:hypothetical protein
MMKKRYVQLQLLEIINFNVLQLLFQGVQGCSAAVVSSAHSILVLALFAVSDSSAVLQSV